MGVSIEASITSLPWVSRDELTGLKGEVNDVRRELSSVREELRRIEDRLLKGEGIDGRVKELRNSIEEVKSRVSAIEGRVKSLISRVEKAEAVIELSVMVGSWKARTCGRCEGGVCRTWRLGKEATESIARIYGGDSVVKDGDVWRVRVSKVPCLCTFCPLYELKGGEVGKG